MRCGGIRGGWGGGEWWGRVRGGEVLVDLDALGGGEGEGGDGWVVGGAVFVWLRASASERVGVVGGSSGTEQAIMGKAECGNVSE